MSEEKGAAEDAKGLADQFVGALGLLDLIAGGIALYYLRLVLGPGAARAFPSTGFAFVDVALLACAASIVGKGVGLAAYVLMAIAEALSRGSTTYTTLTAGLAAYRAATKRAAPADGVDPVDLALATVVAAAPTRVGAIERVEGTALFAYVSCVLAVPYALHFLRHYHARGWLWLACAAGVLLVAYLGYVYQRHYYATLAASLLALAPGADAASAAPPHA